MNARKKPRVLRQKRVLVIGLLEGQAGIVERRCHDSARVRCLGAKRYGQQLPQADHIILMKKFITHRWTEVAFHIFSRDRVHVHPGGIETLVERIKGLVA